MHQALRAPRLRPLNGAKALRGSLSWRTRGHLTSVRLCRLQFLAISGLRHSAVQRVLEAVKSICPTEDHQVSDHVRKTPASRCRSVRKSHRWNFLTGKYAIERWKRETSALTACCSWESLPLAFIAGLSVRRGLHKVSLSEKFPQIREYWKPPILCELNDRELKIDKIRGTFVCHQHEDEVELLLCLRVD